MAWHEDWDFLYIVMEYIELGNLSNCGLLRTIKRQHTENNIKTVAKQLSEGLKIMHDKGIAHRDLNPNNILVRSVDPLRVIIADFGVSKLVPPDGSTKLRTNVGTDLYKAPEILHSSSERGYSPAIDLWSLGCVLYWMTKARTPFKDTESVTQYYHDSTKDNQDTRPKLGLNVRWNLNPGGVKIIHELLHASPQRRPSAKGVSEGRWLRGV
ncbi:kinase-like protein [Wilcoxina mikolae CBS 423.85]|nr:kinase-like protein [Wilcoxina mikolae CBS 423.85]